MTTAKLVLDLCGGSGSWSKPYKDAGYDVRLVTLPTDVRTWTDYMGEDVHGILAAPPCTIFSRAGNRWKRSAQDWLDALGVVDACLRIIFVTQPVWWALENPVGRLVRYLGRPNFYFDPCDFGDPWTKRTCLWGKFMQPKVNRVEPTEGSKIHLMAGNTAKQRLLRAVTPPGFAKAFFDANP